MQEYQERFTDFNLRPELLRAIERKGFEHPMPVQTAVLRDESLAGDDLIVQARTGSGKTLAFALPLLNEMEAGARTPRIIVPLADARARAADGARIRLARRGHGRPRCDARRRP